MNRAERRRAQRELEQEYERMGPAMQELFEAMPVQERDQAKAAARETAVVVDRVAERLGYAPVLRTKDAAAGRRTVAMLGLAMTQRVRVMCPHNPWQNAGRRYVVHLSCGWAACDRCGPSYARMPLLDENLCDLCNEPAPAFYESIVSANNFTWIMNVGDCCLADLKENGLA